MFVPNVLFWVNCYLSVGRRKRCINIPRSNLGAGSVLKSFWCYGGICLMHFTHFLVQIIKHRVSCVSFASLPLKNADFSHLANAVLLVCAFLTGGTSRASSHSASSTASRRSERPVLDSSRGGLQQLNSTNVQAAWL